MEYKQLKIVAAIREKIAAGIWVDRLPTGLELAREFGVNVKTVNKAVHRLVAAGLLSASPKSGICVIPQTASTPHSTDNGDVEVLFEGYTAVLAHPFWREIWIGLLDRLCDAGFRPVLRRLDSDGTTGLLRLDDFHCSDAVGRVVLGITEHRLFRELEKSPAPFLAAGDPVADCKVPQVSFDFRRGIRDAIVYLRRKGCRRIAFIGQTRTLADSGVLEKFRAYCAAIQEEASLDAALIVDARPFAGGGEAALLQLLRSGAAPDAVIAAYDVQVPEMLAALKTEATSLPVVGCDGLALEGVSPLRPMVAAPLRECGVLSADRLIHAIASRHAVKSEHLPAVFQVLRDI